MRLIYLHNRPFPSHYVNTIQVVKMCSAWALNGEHVTLVCPEGIGASSGTDISSYYGVRHPFDVQTLPAWPDYGKTGRLQQSIAVGLAAPAVFASEEGPFVVYCRSRPTAYITSVILASGVIGTRCRGLFLGLHNFPHGQIGRRLVGRAKGIVVNTEALKKRLISDFDVPESRILKQPNAVDLGDRLSRSLEKEEARKLLGVDLQVPLVVYTGTMTRAKGLDTIIECAKRLQDAGVHFVLVGTARDSVVQRLARLNDSGITNIEYRGWVEPAQASRYLDAADILLLPSGPQLKYSDFTSPLKMFEYMATRRPIVANALPVLEEVLTDGENALLAPPDDPESWCSAIQRLLSAPALAGRLAERAFQDVKRYSWEQRASSISAFIDSMI